MDVTINVGATTIRALVSRESRDRLRLVVGQRVWALVKTVALDNRSLGFLRPPRAGDEVEQGSERTSNAAAGVPAVRKRN